MQIKRYVRSERQHHRIYFAPDEILELSCVYDKVLKDRAKLGYSRISFNQWIKYRVLQSINAFNYIKDEGPI